MDSLEKAVRDGKRVEEIQKEAVFQEALDRARTKAYQEFLRAETDDARRTAWAKAHAVEELEQELRVTVDRGISAKVEVDRRPRSGTSR